MKPKKPDRFERMAMNLPICQYGTCSVGSVANLLRKEHAWVRRMVNKVNVWACQESMDNEDVIVEILKQLAQRRK